MCRFLTYATLFCALVAAPSMGQTFNVKVIRAGGPPCNGGTERDQDFPASQNLSLSLSTCAEFVYITAGASVNIPRVTLTGGPSSPLKVAIGATFDPASGDPTPTGNNFGGWIAPPSAMRKSMGGSTET